ncbi:MAG: hypothetical protein HYR84_12200 [Planctomycetes bacterium]|nr:hypothetical protein [Planctomycetota bacterium]
MLGPHFYYDLIRLARNRSTLFLRCGYLLALLFGWWFVYEEQIGTRYHFLRFERLATKYTNALLILQYALIVLLTPMYLAGTVMEEKENRTLELLFQTDLDDREILLGKFSARMVQLMLLVQSSLPLLALISLWGGIRLEMAIFHVVFSLLFILFVGAVSLWASVQGNSFTEALVLAYLTMAIFCIVAASTVLAIVDAALVAHLRYEGLTSWAELAIALGICAGVLVLGIGIFYGLARWRFRKLRDLQWLEQRRPVADASAELSEDDDGTILVKSPDRVIPDNAIAWKETFTTSGIRDLEMIFGVLLAFAVAMGATFAYLSWSPPENWRLQGTADSLRVIFNLGCVATYVGVVLTQGFLAAGSVAKEREQNTLDFLLLLPTERSDIFYWKWLGPWFRNRAMLAGVILLPIIGLASGMFSTSLGLWLLIVPWPTLLLVHSLGILASVMSSRVATANFALVMMLLLIVLAHLVRWNEVMAILEGLPDFAFSFRIPKQIDADTWTRIAWMIAIQQALFIAIAIGSAWAANWLFDNRTSEARTQGR